MAAEPAILRIERDHKAVAFGKLLQQPGAPFIAGHGGAKGAGKPVEERGVDQKIPYFLRPADKNVLFQDQGNVLIPAGQRAYGVADAFAFPDGKRGGYEPRGPTLRIFFQGPDFIFCQVKPFCAKNSSCSA